MYWATLKQHFKLNSWKVKQHWDWVEKIVAYKKTCISRSKGNQSMKSGQLIEYNMENILIEKSYTKCVGETSSRTLSKRSKLSISLDQ